jgi:hypothetical protein
MAGFFPGKYTAKFSSNPAQSLQEIAAESFGNTFARSVETVGWSLQ